MLSNKYYYTVQIIFIGLLYAFTSFSLSVCNCDKFFMTDLSSLESLQHNLSYELCDIPSYGYENVGVQIEVLLYFNCC